MEIKRLFDFIYYQREHQPRERAFGHRRDGEWMYYSTDEIIDLARRLSCGLLRLGVAAGDKVALVVYENRPEWVIVDIAIQQIGAINVPVYPTISAGEYQYIFNDAQVKYCFVGKGDLYDKVKKAQANTPSLLEIYTLDRQSDRPYWQDIFCEDADDEIEYRMGDIDTDDLATLIYTSGTTGNPKGVMLSHRNIISNAMAVNQLLPVSEGEVVLSFLPLCHIFERTAIYVYTYCGLTVVFTGTDKLGGPDGDLQAVKPHYFNTVPRLLEKVYEKIYNTGRELTGLKRSIFFWALSLTEDYEYDKTYSGWAALQRSLADRLVFSKWRAALGGRLKGILVGAAPCPVKIARIFSAAGIPVREGYGLTETSPGLAINGFRPGEAKLGTVGMAVDGVSLYIDESGDEYRPGEGEILATGPNVMMGYYNKPDATAEVIAEMDGQRWLRTGDVGTFVEGPNGNQFLRITDRKKELLKTSGGKYVAPSPIENKLKEDFLIENIMVVGDDRKYVSALIVPAVEGLRDWCSRHGISWTNLEDMIQHGRVREKYQEIVDAVNPLFSHTEQIKKFRLLTGQWEPTKADGSAAELTPTLKLKRRVINDKYAREIEDMYSEQ